MCRTDARLRVDTMSWVDKALDSHLDSPLKIPRGLRKQTRLHMHHFQNH